MAVIRVEDWTKDIDGMITTCVVDIREGNLVRVSDHIVQEFGLDTTTAVRVEPDLEWAEYNYVAVEERLLASGFSRADT